MTTDPNLVNTVVGVLKHMQGKHDQKAHGKAGAAAKGYNNPEAQRLNDAAKAMVASLKGTDADKKMRTSVTDEAKRIWEIADAVETGDAAKAKQLMKPLAKDIAYWSEIAGHTKVATPKASVKVPEELDMLVKTRQLTPVKLDMASKLKAGSATNKANAASIAKRVKVAAWASEFKLPDGQGGTVVMSKTKDTQAWDSIYYADTFDKDGKWVESSNHYTPQRAYGVAWRQYQDNVLGRK